MRPTVLVLSLLPLLLIHLGLTAFAYRETTRLPMDRRKWTAVVGLVPAYGFIVFLLARSELAYDPETDPYAGGSINVHPSRADDVPWKTRDSEDASWEGEEENEGSVVESTAGYDASYRRDSLDDDGRFPDSDGNRS